MSPACISHGGSGAEALALPLDRPGTGPQMLGDEVDRRLGVADGDDPVALVKDVSDASVHCRLRGSCHSRRFSTAQRTIQIGS